MESGSAGPPVGSVATFELEVAEPPKWKPRPLRWLSPGLVATFGRPISSSVRMRESAGRKPAARQRKRKGRR